MYILPKRLFLNTFTIIQQITWRQTMKWIVFYLFFTIKWIVFYIFFLHKNKFLQLIQSLFWFDFDLINAYKSFHWVPVWVFSLGTGESRTLPVISPFWLAWVVIDNRMGQRSLTPSYILDNSLWISTVREKCQRSPNHFSSHSSPRIPLLLPEVRQIQNI